MSATDRRTDRLAEISLYLVNVPKHCVTDTHSNRGDRRSYKF